MSILSVLEHDIFDKKVPVADALTKAWNSAEAWAGKTLDPQTKQLIGDLAGQADTSAGAGLTFLVKTVEAPVDAFLLFNPTLEKDANAVIEGQAAKLKAAIDLKVTQLQAALAQPTTPAA